MTEAKAAPTAAPDAADQPMIRLDRVSKHYPGQPVPAVDDLSLSVGDGEIVVLLGPSGCGKTTTLRLINRLIEPSSGRIFLDGDDVTRVNPDELRRRIGYVIQQVGLFPHMTIAQNIGLIPRALGWDKKRIKARVDELLDLVGLDPATYRARYPKELSGGQQQRVGVARALAADPPAMLMDEPFGAIDPITRERLQDAFLALQERIGKTIVLVTHDLTEALKLGDRIAMLGQRAELVQCDTPAQILAEPANEFVSSFVGTGAAMRRLRLVAVESVELEPLKTLPDPESDPAGAGATVRLDQNLYEALDAMLRSGADRAAVMDGDGRPAGVLSWSSVVKETSYHTASGPAEAAAGDALAGDAAPAGKPAGKKADKGNKGDKPTDDPTDKTADATGGRR